MNKTTENQYKDSWPIYKAHSENYRGDFEYYKDFCKGKKCLELFAGYGRLANYLVDQNISIETVEIEPSFARWIRLSPEKNHICDVLKFDPKQKFERIIAGYNSFCLLLEEDQVRKLLSKIEGWLTPGGMASLSYYHHDYWDDTPGYGYDFEFEGRMVHLTVKCDLSKRAEKKGVWIDVYNDKGVTFQHEYHTRIYEQGDFEKFLPPNLRLVQVIKEYGKPLSQVEYSGWVEYVLQKA